MADQWRGDRTRSVQTLFDVGVVGGLTDGELLSRFTARGGPAAEPAFAALVERHGPMVLRVCRSILRDEHDAQDAFQATFLVLVHRAGSVRKLDSLGSWLYGVALRVAACARGSAARRRAHERRAAAALAPAGGAPDGDEPDLAPVLYEELGRLPERYRAVVVLCYLEGLACEEAARQLGCPVGTVKSRLARGRERLRGRLIRRGLAPAIATGLSAEVASAAVPTVLMDTTLRAAQRFAAPGASRAIASASVSDLTKGAIKAMLLTKLRMVVASVVIVGGLAVGAGVLAQPGPRPPKPDGQAKATGPGPDQPQKGRPAKDMGPTDLPANKTLAREQLDLVEKALNDLNRLASGGEMTFSNPAFSIWGRRRIDALRAAGAGKAEVIAELEKYLEFLKKQETVAKVLFEKAQVTRVDMWDVQYRRLEAETWLNQEKAR